MDDTNNTPQTDQTVLPQDGDGLEHRTVERVMEDNFFRYSMSVIIERALPDVRDGLKPVHRRILYTMNRDGLRAGSKHRKSATVVGAVMGDFHPHGDTAIYDSMVRLAQPWSLRYPLIDGQGNFGSMDGDEAAAMRYTEARMARPADEMLVDIEKDTIDFRDNYDGRLQEPVVLPAKLPNLLLNGQIGIAVGMATNIPPHNLGELVDACIELIDNEEATIDDLLRHVKGPDFPTGATIYGGAPMKQAYMTGRGSIMVRAVANIEETKKGRHQIVVTEVPYSVNKATLIEKIAELVKDKKIQGIADLRDETKQNEDGKDISCLELHKKARNITQQIENANGTKANAGDTIEYTLSVTNRSKETRKGFIVEENMEDVLEYADIIDASGASYTETPVKMLSWKPIDIKPNETINRTVLIKIKSQIPSTPASTSDPLSYDMKMINVYGDTVEIVLPSTPIKTVEQTVKSLPNTGLGANIVISTLLVMGATYFYFRSRLMVKEVGLVRQQFNYGTGV